MIVAGVQMVASSFSVLAVLEGFDLAALEASAPAAIEEALAVEGASVAVLEAFALVALQTNDLEGVLVVQVQTDLAASEDIVLVALGAPAFVAWEDTVLVEGIVLVALAVVERTAFAALEKTVLVEREDTAPGA